MKIRLSVIQAFRLDSLISDKCTGASFYINRETSVHFFIQMIHILMSFANITATYFVYDTDNILVLELFLTKIRVS